jgi:ribosomal protein L37AE/L43A
MSNTLPISENSEFISTSDANERINSVSQLSETSCDCCPVCGSISIHYRSTLKVYSCSKCKSHFDTPGVKSITYRLLKCCPFCNSLNIQRRTRKGDYICYHCLKVFKAPATKSNRVGGPYTGHKLAVSTYRSLTEAV